MHGAEHFIRRVTCVLHEKGALPDFESETASLKERHFAVTIGSDT